MSRIDALEDRLTGTEARRASEAAEANAK